MLCRIASIFKLYPCLLLYRKGSIKPPGAYIISDTPEGGLIERGLIREGGLFTKSNDMDTNDGFSVHLLHILRIQHTILRVKCINSAQVLSQPNQNKDASLFSELNEKSLIISRVRYKWGGV